MRWLILLGLACVSPLIPAASDEMLAAHNALRSSLHLPPLAWSDKLAQAAQDWADTLIKEGKFHHPDKSPWGQNLLEAYRDDMPPALVVHEWAAEAANYDYRNNRCNGMCGHYTQLVWRDTKEVGCAVARKGDREVWACDYNPPGNYNGQRPY
jgi:pathogenesis-related protein 1